MATKRQASAATASPPQQPPATKIEGVMRALQELGLDATPSDVQAHVKERYGMDMTSGHAATATREARGRLREQREAAAAEAAGDEEVIDEEQEQPARPEEAAEPAPANQESARISFSEAI